mgnify:CR=1 FL=1
MDKIKQYQHIIVEVLNEYANSYESSTSPIKEQVIADDKNNHFILLSLGWQQKKHIHALITHLDIIDDKIWIQEDTTEVGIANLLVEKGIPKSEIVLAYFTPLHREYTEFAVS